MATDIYIDDLLQPRLTSAQQAALEFGESLVTRFDPADILDQARRDTGLDDFGDWEFLPRLELLCDEWGSDRGLTGLGRHGLRNKLILFTRNRLLINDQLRRHPKILEEVIRQPTIVAGLPRSGTTHLLNMLAADQRLRSLPLWESYEPVPLPGEEPGEDGRDPRYRRCAEAWAMMQELTPLLAAMHPMHPDHIHEELELMGPDFASYNFEWLCMSPRWRDAYYASDQTPHYHYLKQVLQLLQWRDRQRGEGRSRWVLKCPQHMEQLPVLATVFPDATVAITHRDPVSVLQSSVTMLAYGQRINRKQVEAQALLSYWTDRIDHLLRACVQDRSSWSSRQSLDIRFDEFMADDMSAVRRIYNTAGLELDPLALKDIQRFLHQHPRGKHGRIRYDLAGQFGANPGELSRRFQYYRNAFGVAAEHN